MLLAADIGNTQTHAGVFRGAELVASWRLGTRSELTADELAVRLGGLLRLDGLDSKQLEAAVVSSVVPALSPVYVAMCEARLGVGCLLVGPGVKTGMPILMDNPRELGADRLVNAVAAYEELGGPCVVVDFGTAITFDAVSADGEYMGGLIGPGIDVSIEALERRAAKLPRIELGPPAELIGKTTQESIQAGFAFGFAGAIDGVAARLRSELGEETQFVATGGQAATVAALCEALERVDPDLTLKGLRLVWERNR